ncbi:MAG: class I SAM-dependent methyltransferase [Candidatus Omnitrophica bacterium]|nr:class I SAM-dependent methyltransferase [Candidatus Omnitrophota bacterium]
MVKKLKKLCNLGKLQIMNLRHNCIKTIIDSRFIEISFPVIKNYLIKGDTGLTAYNNLGMDDYYNYYYSYGRYFSPKNILEIGVRYGYSLISLVKGAQESKCFANAVGIDNQSYERGSERVAYENIKSVTDEFKLINADSQKITDLGKLVGDMRFDLIHVDGDHSYKGCLHDLNITKEILADNGVIIIDDIFLGSCRVFQAVNRFLKNNAYLFDVQIINCFRGHAILKKNNAGG